MTEQESRRGKTRRERVEFARSRDILDVANELQMELVRSGRDYRWKEHDSLVISPDKNLWKWFSRNTGGDAISLVETIKEVSFNQSVDFLNDGNFREFQMVERPQEDFKYYLEKYEQPFSAGRDYLRNQRGLSDETIDYFLEQGVLAQANAKLDYFAEGNDGVTTNAIEPVIVFKSLSSSGEVVGASLQGIQENWEKWPKHGYAKVIMKNSDPMTGIHVDIGSSKRLIFTESPIDLMSYYELHKDSLQDVRLVSMDGLKESTIGRHLSQIQAEISGKPLRWTPEQLADGLQVAIDHHFFEDGKNADLITLALDNDKAGRAFIQELEAKGAVINSDLPELKPGQDKTDWNDVLKNQQEEKPDNSRLAQARRKLERLRGEQDEAISRAYSHQALTNGQPVNDKRGGASFMRKQEQIEGQVFSKMDEIRQQEERVERLEHQQHLKEMGLNRQGSGLEMSVQNIPRIREELEKAKRGESFFTKATLKRYQKELTRLEAISEQMGKTSIQPAAQALIDEGLVNQWQKQPNTYFVKGLRRVALELTEEGEFQLSSQIKYHPKTDEERLKVDELLAKQRQENVGLTPSNQEKSISPQPEPIEKNQDEAGWLEKNWDNLTFSIENKKTVVIDPTSIDKTVEEKQTPDNQESIELVWELHRKWEEELAEKIREDLGINHELQAWQFEKEMSRFITTDLDKLFAKRTRLERDAYFADSATSIRKEIDRLDAQILEYIEKAPEQSQEKTDWNDALRTQNQQSLVDLSAVSVENEKSFNNPLELVWELHGKWEDELAEKIREDLGINHELQAWQFEKEMSRFITTDLDKLFAKRTRLERDAYFADSATSIRKEIDRLDAQILEYIEKAPEQSQERLIDRTSGGTGSLQLEAEGSPTPVLETSTFEQTVTSHPTSSYPYLHFSTNYDKVQRRVGNYHPITPADLRRLNQYAPSIQSTASWYLSEMADSKISFVYADHGEENVLQVTFQKDNFIHLSGIRPFEEGKGAANFLDDIANGQGHYDGMLISNAIKDKLQVLPMLRDILDPHSFVLDDLSSVEKLHNLNMSEAIKAKDEDFLLLFKDIGDEKIPASLMKLKGELATNVKSLDEKIILGVYRERDGHIEQLSINEEYVKDKGAEMLSVLRNKQYEEVPKESEQTTSVNTIDKNSLDSVTFTQVLDTVYNLGVPNDISKTPEKFHQAWDQYLDYAKKYNDKFDQIIAAAGKDHLLDTNSDFYKEWIQDHIYKENYHVRLQWSEERPEGPILPFKETELISYQDFARELYKANQDFYPIHQEGMKQVTAGNTEGYIPPTKIKFDVYAPGGEVIKEGIRYDIGDETTPISQMLGLGYRRLNGQSELASMDEEILSQLENREVNKEISQEANESARLTGEEEGQTPDTRETVAFQSSKQETKTNLLQRVEEILKEEPISDLETPEVNSSSIDYASLTPHELSEVAFQKVREYTETPERLEEYLNFMSKFPELSPRNVALIHEQWPGANAVATYNQWQSMGEVLGITSDQVFETRNTYTNKKTGRTREVVHNNLSVKTGEKSHITLFRPMMVEMIPVLDENGNQVKNGKGNPKYKRLSEATPEEKALKKEGKLKSRFFQERDSNTGLAKFATYKVFELSQTTLKPEFYPKAMPNRHYDFNMDHIRTKEVLEGLSDYAKNIGVTIYQDDAKELRSAKGSFYPDEQKILLNPDNTPGEVIATTIHELAHASLHNPKFANSYKEDVSKDRRELEAEMTSYLVSKHFGLDTSEKAIRYMAIWTDNLTSLDDQQLAQSMKRIHGTVSKIVKSVEQHTKPYQLNRQVVQNQNFIQSPKKGLKV
ncbi:PBECR4 domain-containing protein [Streptococcus sp. Marseille-Q5855]|uniref:PBECR4 domain-containing protein n=1 Tax=Streptococcus sp. Marseille-Q5855 TaxID=2972781 RepID=UPI0021C65663|nr:PBECR4 domain-containing protein [Streptococcus sp. Marseille-Q5855]